jgi:hypothetical protein
MDIGQMPVPPIPPTPPFSMRGGNIEVSTSVYRYSNGQDGFVVRSFGKVVVVGDSELQFAKGARVDVGVVRLGNAFLVVWDNRACRIESGSQSGESCTIELCQDIVSALRQQPAPPTPPTRP